jgi:hypothetical protein
LDVPRALTEIAEIRASLAKAEVYRGYRSVPIAASGIVGFGAAWLQPATLSTSDPTGFVLYWAIVAFVAGSVGASEIVYNYIVNEDEVGRRRTWQVTGQFLPSLLAGVIVTVSLLHLSASLVPLLPGLWAICFGLGIFASRPFLPRASTLVAFYFYVAGTALIWTAEAPTAMSGWHVGLTFGIGQLIGAVVLYWQVERPWPGRAKDETEHDEKEEDRED